MAQERKPPWLRIRMPLSRNVARARTSLRTRGLHTVCEEALCPNRAECWSRGTATFLILGPVCSRSCGFCAVRNGTPEPLDSGEPERVAAAAVDLGLKHVVITSVTRDDLADGGAWVYAETVRAVRRGLPGCTVEVLIPDFLGRADALRTVLDAAPEVLNHNVETVPRLYGHVRPQARYERSLEVLRRTREYTSAGLTKSGLMVGLGESRDELMAVMKDLRAAGCDILTVGQYLQPGRNNLPVERYYRPEVFDELKEEGLGLGFRWVESGPQVRSSYLADAQVAGLGVRS